MGLCLWLPFCRDSSVRCMMRGAIQVHMDSIVSKFAGCYFNDPFRMCCGTHGKSLVNIWSLGRGSGVYASGLRLGQA